MELSDSSRELLLKHYGAEWNRNSSFLQATLNSVNILLGIGMLSCPFALQRGGWLSISILFLCGVMFCYTAHTLGLCLAKNPGISTYQEVSEVALGRKARVLVSLLLYFELLGVLISFTISLADNLVKLFPDVRLQLPWIQLPPQHLLPLVAFLVVLPTVWLQDLRWISYISLGGVATYLAIVIALLWAGVFEGLGFHHSVPVIRPSNLASVAGLFAFCYSGHVIFPSIYSSIKNPSQYPKVLLLSFVVATTIYTGFAFVGTTMFGDKIEPQVTLNLPTSMVVAKISICVIVLNPLTKYSMAISPIALELERLTIRAAPRLRRVYSILIRTGIMAVILALAFALPFFDNILALIGSALSMTMCVVFPCAFYLKIFGQDASRFEVALNCVFIAVGLVLGVAGSVDSVKTIIYKI